jgi:hypothetical protein
MLHGDEAAASDLAGDEAFRFQEFIGGGDGGAIQSKCTSQFAGGGEALAIRQLPGLDEAAKVRVELPIDREGRGGVQLRLVNHRDSIPYWMADW